MRHPRLRRARNWRAAGEAITQEVFPHLHSAARSAPSGELSQFSALAVANQYRVPYGLTLHHVAPPAKVLDWGCGDGHFSYFLLQAGYQVVAYSLQHRPHVLQDLDSELAGRFEYVQGSLSEPTRLPFQDSSFDAVFSVGVLEHVRETGGSEVESLLEIRRVLKPGGHFLCFHLPNQYSYVEAISRVVRRGAAPNPSHDAYHRFRFSVRQTLELCRRSGLTVVSRGRYAFLPRNILSRLPKSLRDSPDVTRLVNRLDDGLATVFNGVCQNHFLVART